MSKASRERERARSEASVDRQRRSSRAVKLVASVVVLAGLVLAASVTSPPSATAASGTSPPSAPLPQAATDRPTTAPTGPSTPLSPTRLSESEADDLKCDPFYDSPVDVFIAGDRLWKQSTLEDALDGDREFVHAGQLVHPDKVREFGGLCGVEGVTRDKIDVCLAAPTRGPEEGDVVQVLDMSIEPPLGTHARFAAVGSLQGGEKVRFQYHVYNVVATGPHEFELHFVEDQYGLVRRTWKSTTDTVIDLTYRTDDGRESTVSGTTEHPFFVPAVGDFVPLSELAIGTVLKTTDGSIATVTSTSRRHGEFEVFGFDVEGHNTYSVAGKPGDPGVLVHNASNVFGAALRAPVRNVGARTFARNHVPRAGGGPARSYLGGLAGERSLRGRLGAGARSQIEMATPMGRRFLDVRHGPSGLGVAHEAKVGWVGWGRSVRRQIMKDAWIAANHATTKIGSVEWTFMRSRITGEVGADPRVLAMLTKNNIPYRFVD